MTSLCIVTFYICMSSNIQIDQNCMQIHMRSLCHKAYLFSFFFQLILLDVIKMLDLVIWFLIWFGEPMWHTHIYFWSVLVFQANSKETKRFFVPFYAILWPCEVVGILTKKKKKKSCWYWLNLGQGCSNRSLFLWGLNSSLLFGCSRPKIIFENYDRGRALDVGVHLSPKSYWQLTLSLKFYKSNGSQLGNNLILDQFTTTTNRSFCYYGLHFIMGMG